MQRADGGSDSLTWSEYAGRVERYAAALRDLGAGPGRVVALQLPNRCETSALVLAVLRTGAVATLISVSMRARELELALQCVRPTVVITAAESGAYDHGAALAEMRPRLPFLRHSVVIDDGTGDVDFAEHFEGRPWPALPLEEADDDPDRIAVVMFTSGTSGSPKAALHTYNTLYAAAHPLVIEENLGPHDVMFSPHELTHIVGLTCLILLPVMSGGAAVTLDVWSPAVARTLIDEVQATMVSGIPSLLSSIWDQYTGTPTAPIKLVITAGTTVPPQMVVQTRDVTGVSPRTLYGMTEDPIITFTRSSDPVDWSEHSDGRVNLGAELDLRGAGTINRENPATVHLRSPGLAVATLDRDSGQVTVIADRDDGWYDTGDLAVPDGWDGIRIVGRSADRINRGFMVPAVDVEPALLKHPGVAEVALVGVQVEHDTLDQAVAVIVPTAGATPTLGELREFLTAQGMTDWYLPTHVLIVDALPRNTTGKILKERLRRDPRVKATVRLLPSK